jgi:hypothetical protein
MDNNATSTSSSETNDNNDVSNRDHSSNNDTVDAIPRVKVKTTKTINKSTPPSCPALLRKNRNAISSSSGKKTDGVTPKRFEK